MNNLTRRFVLMVIAVGALGCAGRTGSSDFLVEELLESGASALPLEFVDVEGERDGARTRATFHFGGASTELHVELMLTYDPQPVLGEGRWRYRGPTGTAEGTVRAESVRFVGGQGEGVSVGGVYVLDEAGHSRFRVRLPLTAIAQGWSPEAD